MQKKMNSAKVSCALAALVVLGSGASAQQRPAAIRPPTPGDNAAPVNSMFRPGPPKAALPMPIPEPGRSASDTVGIGHGGGGGVQDTGITLLDFEGFRYDDDQFHDLPPVIYEDGFIVAVDGGDQFPFATNGTYNAWNCGSAAIYNNTIGGTTYVYAYDLSPFSLEFIDISNFALNGPTTVTFHGVKYDGTIVDRACTTLTSDNREETFYFPGFTDLYYVYWTQDEPYHQFDNVGLVRAPVVIDFESLQHVDGNIVYAGATYYEDGFTVWDESGQDVLATFGTLEARYPGSTAMFNNVNLGVTGLTQVDGSAFNLHSVDISNLNADGPTSVTFVGTRADGFQVAKTVKTGGAPNVLETFALPGFTNVVVVKWTQESPYHQFDNLLISRGQQTLDFVKLAMADDQVHEWGHEYRQDGFRVKTGADDSHPFETFGSYHPKFPGSTALFNNTAEGLNHLETIDGAAFQMRGIELSELNVGGGPVSVDFVGHKSDGSTLNQTFTTSGHGIRLETFDFPLDWRGLDDVEWVQASPYHQFDTVRLVRSTPLLDFQKLEHMDDLLTDVGKTYAEEGFRLTQGANDSFPFATYGTYNGNYNGSTAIFNNTAGGLIRLAAADGGDFDLLQMDLSTLTDGLGDATVTFVGTKTDGTQVVRVFTINGTYLVQQTCRFVGFDTLKKVEWTQDFPYHQIDNIVAVESAGEECYPDCNGDGTLDLFDFLCFVNDFNTVGGYSNCDGNGSHDLFDFLCYVNAFNGGC